LSNLKKAGLAAAVGAAALAISGCYAFSGLTTSKTVLKPGKTSTINVKSYGVGNPEESRDVFFLLINLPNNSTSGDTSDDPLVAQRGKFDTTGVVYRRPKPLRPNTVLRDFLVSEGECGSFDFADAPSDRWLVLATEGRVRQVASRKQVTSRYVLKQIRFNEFLNPTAMITAVGAWDDDGDGVPEPASGFPSFTPSEVSCNGGATHNLNLKQPPSSRPTTKRDLFRAYGG
jgi:hypothetical protein